MKRWRHWVAGMAAAAAVLSLGPPPVEAAETSGRVTTVTRLVKLFLDKEASIATAVRDGDATALGGLLADDFELRIGSHAASPIPRAQWIANVMRTRDPGGDIAGMAVHDFGGVAVASFTQPAQVGLVFVVDVWRGSGDQWKLQVRYASVAGAADAGVAGAGPVDAGIEKKY